jgi:hypothetical protein
METQPIQFDLTPKSEPTTVLKNRIRDLAFEIQDVKIHIDQKKMDIEFSERKLAELAIKKKQIEAALEIVASIDFFTGIVSEPIEDNA